MPRVAVPGPDDFDVATVELGRWGSRFVRPETERAYETWHAERAVAVTRSGLFTAALSWLFALGAALVARLEPTGAITAAILGVMTPVLATCIAFTYRPSLRRWMLPTLAIGNLMAGLLLVFLCLALLHRMDFACGAVAISAFVATAVYRMRPAQALLAAVPPVAVFECALFAETARGHVTVASAAGYAVIAIVALGSGVQSCIATERASRAAFRDERIIDGQRRTIEHERARADDLLHSILPVPIAARLKRSPGPIADGLEDVTVLFADIVGFTPVGARMAPQDLVCLLNDVFSAFDEMAGRHGLEKIKTIGDAYMVVGGAPETRPDHTGAVASMALEMRAAVERIADGKLALRIGMHAGPAVAGVIGTKKYAYDLWGDTVNTASRMESHGEPGRIHVTKVIHDRLREEFRLSARGRIPIKGKGEMETWFLEGRRAGG